MSAAELTKAFSSNATELTFFLFQVKACGEIAGLTSPFVDEMYHRLNGTLDEYEIIIRRWPEYAISLEKVSETIRTYFYSL